MSKVVARKLFPYLGVVLIPPSSEIKATSICLKSFRCWVGPPIFIGQTEKPQAEKPGVLSSHNVELARTVTLQVDGLIL